MSPRKASPAKKSPLPVPPGQAVAPQPPEVAEQASFPVVGIGASAGGLAAFEAFFAGMPADQEPGMAFVLVQHLAPDHKSILTELVKRYTRMEVFEVEDGVRVRPNCAYIIPPNRDMAFLNGTLQLMEPAAPRGLRLPIDFFFRSLALDQRERAICIVLSGTGSDGALGVRAVKGEGGMAMAQALETTEYDGMPHSAIATGLVDYVLPPAQMAAQLIAYAAHAFARRTSPAIDPSPKAGDALRKICVLLRDHTGHDFSQYKQNTLIRRVERRMAVHMVDRTEDYLRLLRNTQGEAQALFRDLLIGVTNFFRDPEAFALLEHEVIPKLFVGKHAGAPIRVWVCGCATGEEAYSVAILLQEHLESLRHSYKIQVFATDIDPESIEQARTGVFPASIAADLSPERLARFFTQEEEGGPYRIQKVIRDLLVFSEQDVIRDPPFSKLDLITCRNLMIYLNGELQRKLIPLFHYALLPGGSLFLGTSETVGEFGNLFTTLDRKHKIYRRQEDLPGAIRPTLGGFVPPLSEGAPARPVRPDATETTRANLRRLTEATLLSHYAQAGALINGRGEILHIYGRTGRFLEPAAGDAGLNILTMAREGLRPALTSALYRVVSRKEPVFHPGLRVKTNGDYTTVNMSLRPVIGDGPEPRTDLFLVILEDAPLPAEAAGAPALEAPQPTTHEVRRIAELEQELRTKEELQSVNEELATVNAELQNKVSDLSRANNDMNNLLAGTGVATLFVDHQLRIVRFTPSATELINLILGDIGRPVSHIVSNLAGYDKLVEDVQAVLRDLTPREVEVETRTHRWFLMRIRPYRTLDNVIEGAVITFTDITDRRLAQSLLEERERELSIILNGMFDPFALLDLAFDAEGRVSACRLSSVNGPFEVLTGLAGDRWRGKNLGEAWPGTTADWETVLQQVALDGQPARFDLVHRATGRSFLCSVMRPGTRPDRVCIILKVLPPAGKAQH